jgi:hypothetical protein
MTIPVISQIASLKKGLKVNNATAVQEVTYLPVSAALIASMWQAGDPLAVDANGLKLATVNGGTGASDVAYIAANSYKDVAVATERINGVDVSSMVGATAEQQKQVYCLAGEFLCEMYADSTNGILAETYPFLQTPSSGAWAVGANVYLTGGEKWNDTAIGAEIEYGVVEEVFGDPALATGLRIRFFTTRQTL